MQEIRNSITDALELHPSSTYSSTCVCHYVNTFCRRFELCVIRCRAHTGKVVSNFWLVDIGLIGPGVSMAIWDLLCFCEWTYWSSTSLRKVKQCYNSLYSLSYTTFIDTRLLAVLRTHSTCTYLFSYDICAGDIDKVYPFKPVFIRNEALVAPDWNIQEKSICLHEHFGF